MKVLKLLPFVTLLITSTTYAKDIIQSKIVTATIDKGTVTYFTEGKGGNTLKSHNSNEDGLFFNNHYLAVFDGATDKSGMRYDGRKGGRVARDIIKSVFEKLPPATPPTKVVSLINKAYQKFYAQHPNINYKDNPVFRPTSTLIWYDFDTNTLVDIGDSKARIDGVEYGLTTKLVDELNSELRSFTLKKLRLSHNEIMKHDLGREYILPLLKKQADFQNNPNAPKAFQFWVIDGFDIPEKELGIFKFKETPKTIELSSDGYLYAPKPTVQSYEKTLKALIKQDPLMMDKNKSTKGIKGNNVSFDDRTILIFNKK